MNVEAIVRLYAYNKWANARFVAAAAALTEPQFTAQVASSFPSVRDTLAHIVWVELAWLRRWQGESAGAPPPWLDSPTLPTLRGRLEEIERERDRYLAQLSTDQLERTVHYRLLSGTARSSRLADLLVHVVNHSTYHRGQLTTILRQVGAAPPKSDFELFAGENA